MGELADTVLWDCNIVDVANRDVYRGDIALKDGFIAGVGDVGGLINGDTRVVEMNGWYVAPGFIDAHVHVESSHLRLTEYARLAQQQGITSFIADPHEIANALGPAGVQLMLDEARQLPMDVFFTAPSCVPSTPLETSGGRVDREDVKKLLREPVVVALGEVMNYEEVLAGDPELIGKIRDALSMGLVVDGHAPGLHGEQLQRYAGVGITSDHESQSFEEAMEKARLGMKVMIREGTTDKNLHEFVPRLLDADVDLDQFLLVSDDVSAHDLANGHFNKALRRAIDLGLSPLDALRMATINPARHYRVDHLVGLLAPGRHANLVVLEDLESMSVAHVHVRGREFQAPEYQYPEWATRTVSYMEIIPWDLTPRAHGREARVNVIELQDSLETGRSVETLPVSNDHVQPLPEEDVLAVAVVERHKKTGNIGHGFVRGLGLDYGAIGQSIGHDAHNAIVVGADLDHMAMVANELREMQGGIAAAWDGAVRAHLHLPLAGLMSLQDAEVVQTAYRELLEAARGLGCKLEDPFQAISFLTLPVIPHLRVTDKGLVDVDAFQTIPTLA